MRAITLHLTDEEYDAIVFTEDAACKAVTRTPCGDKLSWSIFARPPTTSQRQTWDAAQERDGYWDNLIDALLDESNWTTVDYDDKMADGATELI